MKHGKILGWVLVNAAWLVMVLGGCGGQKAQPTKPGPVDPAAVKAHDAQVDQEEGQQRAMEEKGGR